MPGVGKLRSGTVITGDICEEPLTDDDTIECAWVMIQAGKPSLNKYSNFGGININPCSEPFVFGLHLRESGEAPANRQPTFIPGPIKLHDVQHYGALDLFNPNTICFNYLEI